LLAALPVLDNSADPTLGQTQEDAGTPTGVVGTLVSALIDTDGPLDNFSDADGDLPGIAITGVNLQEGTLWSSENNGTGWQQVGTVSDASPRLLAADAGSRLYFQPAADFSGAINDVITFKAWDRTFILQQLGTDIDGEAAGDESGRTVSMSADGQTVAIGASGNDDNGIDSGHVRVYQWTGSAWQQQGSDIDGEAAGDEAGKWNSLSLSSDGQMVAIGALYNDGNGNDSGHVRIYQWSGSAWQQLGADIDGEAAGDASGFAVSLSSDGQTVATGALYNGGNGALAGHVRIHQWTGSEWQQLGADIDGEAAGDNVHSVSLSSDGQTVAIGARRNDGNGTDSGSTRVYQWTGSAWQQLGSDIDGEAAEDQSGYSLSLSSDGQIVAIGALYNDGNGTDSGSTRVYQWTGSAWQQVGSDIDGEAAEDLSGVSLSLSSNGQTVAIAAHSNDANGDRAGQVRIYDWSGSEWEQLGADIDGEAADDLSGGSVSLSSDGQTVAVGAMFNDGNGVDSGHVRIYRAHPVKSVAADSVSVTVDPINDDPTLDAISDVTIDEDAAQQTVGLEGIGAGANETQALRVTASSDSTGLIPNPSVTYTSANATGTIAFTPVADQSGTATITVMVEDAGLDNDVATTEDNETFSRTFDVVVNPINDDPTLDAISDVTIDEDAPEQTVALTGITAGGGESQQLNVTAEHATPGGRRSTYGETITRPAESVIADLNGDTHLDFAVVDYASTTLNVFLSEGDGNFQEPRAFQVGQNPLHLAIGDFNDDGLLDFVTSNRWQNSSGFFSASVIFGDGSGGFSESTELQIGQAPADLRVADLNRDGIDDVLVTCSQALSVAILISNGDGTFLDATYVSTAVAPHDLVLDDLDHDGDLDMIVANREGNEIQMFRGDGAAGFTAPSTIPQTGTWPNTLQSGDLDGDGNTDFVTVYGQGDRTKVSLHYGLGNGSFSSPETVTFAGFVLRVQLADFDGDGSIDIIATLPDDDQVEVAINDDSLSFAKRYLIPFDREPHELSVADINRDGWNDILVSGVEAGTVGILYTEQTILLTHNLDYTSPASEASLQISPGSNLNGSAIFRVTVEDAGLNGTLDDPLFADATSFSVGTDPHSVSVGDFNGDGKQDLVTADRNDDNVSILLGDGSGAFSDATTFSVGDEPQSIFLSDFNGDGNQDVATANSGDDNVSILLGDGSGSFMAAANVASGPVSSSVSVGDFNGDGKQDLVVTNDTPSNAVSILLGDGTGSFSSPTTFAVGLRPYSVSVGDFDGDGHQDLAVVNHSDDNVSILLGDGNGSFAAATNFAVNDQPVFVSVGDFNGDGNQDLVTANFLSKNVSILLGDGSGSFAEAVNFGVGSGPETLSVGDFNGDGKQDVATANVNGNDVSILLGDGSGSFAEAANFGVGSGPETVSVGDFNGDGYQDLATANRSSNNVSILMGGGDNATFIRTFEVVVTPVNDDPTLDAISDLTIDEDAGQQIINLAGIGSGPNESQSLRVAAISDNPGLIPDPTVTYTSANPTGSLDFTSVANQHGAATITVTVEDDGLDNDLATTADNATFSRTFDVVVTPVNDAPVLDGEASPALNAVAEDAQPPVGAVGTLVSALIDANNAHENFSDVDGDQPGLAIVGISPQGGHVWISRDNGHTWNVLDEPSEEKPVLLLADMVSRVYFQPAVEFSGTISDVITFKAWDRTFIGRIEGLGSTIEGLKNGDNSGMGLALSSDGTTLAIGAPGHDNEQGNVGQVRVFQWSGSDWVQLGSDIYGESANDQLGRALSLSADGKRLAVGTYLNDGTAADAGHARVYSWNGENWIQLGSDLDGYAANDWYGIDVDLSNDGTILAVGARDGGANDGGYTDVFRWNGLDWEEIGQRLMGQRGGGRFGQSISLSANGTVIVIGAEFARAMTGEAFVYAWDGQQWQQMGSTFNAESSADRLGHSVSISGGGEVVAISAHYDDENGTDSGHTKIFQWNGTDWEQKGQDIDGEAAGDKSGYDISLSDDGNRIAIGARFNDGGGNNSGHARIYQWNGSQWLQFGDDIDGAGSNTQLSQVVLSGDGTKVAVGNWQDGVDSPTTIFHLEQIPSEFSISNQKDFISVNVESSNDPPVLGSLPEVVIDEDGVVHGAGTNLKLFASDVDSDESKLEFRIVNLTEIDPQFGLSIGMDTQSDSFALRGDSTIHVHPAANFFGSTQVTIEARDPEGDVSSQQTFNLVINSVNDRPVLDASANLSFPSGVEDSGAPVGQAGTLVSTLIDENGPLANFSDIDGLAPGIAIVGKNITVEKTWFSTDDGQNWQAVGSVSVSEALLLIADTTTRVYAETADDVSGELSDALTIKAWDQTGGHGNGVTGVDSTTNAFSLVTDTVSLSVDSSPSSAADDFYSPLVDGTETFLISKSDLLANDTLGNGESIDTVTIITDTISSAGGTISVDGDVFTYTRPANWFSGIDTFGYTLADGGSTSTATVTILSGVNGDTLTITLEPGRDHEMTLQYMDDKLVMVDHVTQATLLNVPRELVPANIDVVGAPANSNIVTLKELSGETPGDAVSSWSYQGGSESDELSLLGSADVWALLSRDAFVENDVYLQLKQKLSTVDIYHMLAVENIRIAQVDRVAFTDPYFEVQSGSFGFSTYQPVILPEHTDIAGGALNSAAPIALDAGRSLVGAGIVDGPFGGVTGSLIRATGNLEIGTDQSSDGFRTDGRLETGVHTVTINDSNRATLGELTTLGSESQTGTLLAKHGLTVPFTGNIEGYGTVDTTNGETTSILLNNGSIAGKSSDEPITLTATVKGVGTMTNVVLDGTFTPGFSPTLSVNGDLVYGDRNTVEIELGGYLAGSGHDRIEHTSAFLDGKLVAKLIDGYQPRPGAMFEILKSLNDFTGSFDSIELPSFDNGLRLEEIVDFRSISLETVFETLDELHVLVSEQANFEISDWHDTALKIRGSKFKAQVTPQHGFHSETSWFTDHAFMKDDVLIQSTTDGVNRIDIAGSRWKNFVSPHDINNDGKTSVLDALTIVNELARGSFVDLDTNQLTPPSELIEWPGIYYDTNGDDRGTALDALLVINELARTSNSSGEGELADVAIEQWSRDLTPISTAKPTSDPLTQNPNFPSRTSTSSPESASYISSPQVVDAEHESMGRESLKTLDESLVSLLAE
jgi:hypothetical protein